MLIFWESRLVFLATPKAGSTAVEAALEALANVAVQRPAVLKHADLRTYRRHIEPWLHSARGDAGFIIWRRVAAQKTTKKRWRPHYQIANI